MFYWEHTKNSKSETVSISLNDKVISESDSYKYFGVTMDIGLTMKEHLAKTYKTVLSRKSCWFVKHQPIGNRNDLQSNDFMADVVLQQFHSRYVKYS